MTVLRALVTSCAVLLLIPSRGGAQASAVDAAPGSRVRVLRSGDEVPQEATLISFDRGTLVMQPGGCCLVDSIPIDSLVALDVSRGVTLDPGRVLGGMTWGLLAGAGAGWAVGALGCHLPGAGEMCALGAGKWMAILGAGGLVAGMLWGIESKEDDWDRVYPPGEASLLIAPNREHGVMVGVSLPWAMGDEAGGN